MAYNKIKINFKEYRIYLLLIFIIFPLWAFVMQIYLPDIANFEDTYFRRFLFVIPAIIFYIASYFFDYVKNKLHWAFLISSISIHLGHGYLVSLSGFHQILVSGQLLVSLLILIHFESIIHFIIFSVFSLSVVFFPSPIEILAVPRSIYFYELLTVILVTFIVLLRKLKLQKEIIENEKKLEEQKTKAFHAERLSSLGMLAGGIAHEINNPLSILALTNERLFKYSDGSEKAKLAFDKHKETVSRMTKIIKSLKSVSRTPTIDHEKLNINLLLDDVVEIINLKTKEKGIKLNLDFDQNMTFMGNLVELQQVVINLIGNAIDAVEDKDIKTISIKTFKEQDKLKIIVEDSGNGVKDKDIEHIFDPFYTTKEVGKGTGIGLSISRQIIENHKGLLFVDPYQTNRFVIELNLMDENI